MATNHNAKLRKTTSLLKETIPKMSQLQIPLTPENYHTWYEYTRGGSLELNKSINELLKNGEKFTSKVNEELYSRHINQSQEDVLKLFQRDVQKLVSKLFEKINGMTKTTQDFSNSLEKYNDVLQSDPDIESMTSLIANLIDDTGSVLDSNQAMESMMVHMNEEVESLRDNLQSLNTKAFTDQLTAIPNRRAFDETIDELFVSYQDTAQVFSLLLIDIDHFKQFNDTHGHDVGDRVLKYVASIMKGGIKGDDMVARYGGEEFVVLLPNTDYNAALSVADYLRKKISRNKLVDRDSDEKTKSLGYVTVSIGVAANNAHDDPASITKRADKSLYLAKKKGRNKVIGELDL